MLGNEIKVYMDSIGQSITEYLVNFEFVKDIMKKNGFEVSIPENMNPRYSQILRRIRKCSHIRAPLEPIQLP